VWHRCRRWNGRRRELGGPWLKPDAVEGSSGPGPFAVEDLRELLDHVIGPAPFGFAVYDRDLRYVMVNEALAALNGRSPDEHHGLRITDVAPDLADEVTEALERVLATGEPVLNVELVGESPGQRGKRGIWLNSFYRLAGPAGQVVGVAAVVRDVTEERRVAEQAAAEQFRAAFDASLEPAVIVVTEPGADGEPDLRVDYLNPAATQRTGLSLSDAIGRRLTEVFPAVDELDLMPRYREVLDTGRPVAERDLSFRGVEREVHFDLSITRIPAGLLVQWRDADLEHQLIEQQRALVAERSRVAQLQRSFLPRMLPTVSGLAVAARYQSADEGAALGGDWYDALALEGELVVCVGDVAGHGMGAVEIMGVARITARAFIAEDSRPDRVLTRLDHVAARFVPWRDARPLMTMIAATYDPANRRLRWSNAGHPPPLVVDADGARLLDSIPQPPLGVGVEGYTAHEVTLRPRSCVVLYTDGLVERRDENLDRGFARLVSAARDLPSDPAAVAEVLLERCAGPHPRHDDICVLVFVVE
jgi:PAS domain S-box-containing protein